MNRRQKRRKAAMDRSTKFVETYVRNLPEIGPSELGAQGVTHIVLEHDDWCELYSGRGTVCNCNPDIRYFKEPKRS